MTINWFPGHLNNAKREIASAMPRMDLIIEVLDARVPFSSSNPLVPQLRGDKPSLKVLNKSDLADPAMTKQWLDYFNAQDGVTAMALNIDQRHKAQDIVRLGTKLVPAHRTTARPLAAMIMGIPNVGKSTIINTLVGRAVAVTGNKPAVTKMQSRHKVNKGFVLFDTPGFLWPRLAPAACGPRLAATGAIKDSIFEYQDVSMFTLEFMSKRYPKAILDRYKLTELPDDTTELLRLIASKRGCLRKGGVLDMEKVSEILVFDLRQGKFGGVTFEVPGLDVEVLKEENAHRQAVKDAKKAAKEAKKAGSVRDGWSRTHVNDESS